MRANNNGNNDNIGSRTDHNDQTPNANQTVGYYNPFASTNPIGQSPSFIVGGFTTGYTMDNHPLQPLLPIPGIDRLISSASTIVPKPNIVRDISSLLNLHHTMDRSSGASVAKCGTVLYLEVDWDAIKSVRPHDECLNVCIFETDNITTPTDNKSMIAFITIRESDGNFLKTDFPEFFVGSDSSRIYRAQVKNSSFSFDYSPSVIIDRTIDSTSSKPQQDGCYEFLSGRSCQTVGEPSL
jgi:hypothetical protein